MKPTRIMLMLAFLLASGAALVLWSSTGLHREVQSAPNIAGTAVLSVSPSAQTAAVGDIITATITISDPDAPVSSFQFDLTYDAQILALEGVTPPRTAYLAQNGRLNHCLPPARPASGTLRYACASTSTAVGTTGNGTLVQLTFRALDTGVSPLQLTQTTLADTAQPPAPFTVTTNDGEITVGTPVITATPSSTPTTTPTATPTATATGTIEPTDHGIFLPLIVKE